MCIIAVTKKPNLLQKDTLENCWENNHHGAGFAYVDRDKIKVVKELSSFKRFWHLFQKHREIALEEQSPMVIHFRVASHGEVSIANIHPFFINKNLIMAHNGVLPIKEEGKKSDTRTFCDSVLRKFPVGFEGNQAYTFLIEGWMGKGSKIVFMNHKKELVILNRSAWEQEDKLETLFSNRSFLYRITRSTDAGFKSSTIGTQGNLGFPFGGNIGFPLGKSQSLITDGEVKNSVPPKAGDVEIAIENVIKTSLTDNCDMCGLRVSLKDEAIYRVRISGESNTTMLCKDCVDHLSSSGTDINIVDAEVGITGEIMTL